MVLRSHGRRRDSEQAQAASSVRRDATPVDDPHTDHPQAEHALTDQVAGDGQASLDGTETAPAAATTEGRSTETTTPPARARREYVGAGIMSGVIALFVVAAAVVILVAQNSHPVDASFLWFDGRPNLSVLLLAAIVGTAIVTELVGLIWRHRRRRAMAMRNELEELRQRV